jgi:hypothetical protein
VKEYDTQEFYGELVHMTCETCGVHYGLDSTFDDARSSDLKTFHCPNGHVEVYDPPTAEDLAEEAISIPPAPSFTVTTSYESEKPLWHWILWAAIILAFLGGLGLSLRFYFTNITQ